MLVAMENQNLEMLVVHCLKVLVLHGTPLHRINITGHYQVIDTPGKEFNNKMKRLFVVSIITILFSDECVEEEMNDYAELNVQNHHYLPGGFRKPSEEGPARPLISQSLDCERFRNLAMRTPDRSVRSASVAVPRRRQRSRSTAKQDVQNKTQVSFLGMAFYLVRCTFFGKFMKQLLIYLLLKLLKKL